MAHWKDIVGTVAPALAGLLGGPLAGVAVKALSEALLGTPDGSEEAVENAILVGQSPELLAKLKQIEADLTSKLADAGVKIEDIHQRDRASARELAKANGMLPQVVLSTLFVTGYFAIVYVLLAKQIEIAESMRDAALMLVGVLTAAIPQILQFWFGSSRGSQSKDQLIDRLSGK
jgi:hypothetical protein